MVLLGILVLAVAEDGLIWCVVLVMVVAAVMVAHGVSEHYGFKVWIWCRKYLFL